MLTNNSEDHVIPAYCDIAQVQTPSSHTDTHSTLVITNDVKHSRGIVLMQNNVSDRNGVPNKVLLSYFICDDVESCTYHIL